MEPVAGVGLQIVEILRQFSSKSVPVGYLAKSLKRREREIEPDLEMLSQVGVLEIEPESRSVKLKED